MTLRDKVRNCEIRKILIVELLIRIEQGFPTWVTCAPRGTFAYLKGYM